MVTGATGGIGRATAERLAAAGASVVLAARSAAAVHSAAAELGGLAIAADVSTDHGVRALADAAGTADIVVHAAGSFTLAPAADTSVEAFDAMLAVNLRAAFLLVHEFLPRMLERGSGHLVAIGSVAGRRAMAGNLAYGASKFGVRGMYEVLAGELRGTGVRATFVEPAATDTSLWEGIDRARYPELPQRAGMLDAGAVADAVLYAVTRPVDVAIPNILMERA